MFYNLMALRIGWILRFRYAHEEARNLQRGIFTHDA